MSASDVGTEAGVVLLWWAGPVVPFLLSGVCLVIALIGWLVGREGMAWTFGIVAVVLAIVGVAIPAKEDDSMPGNL